MEGGDLLYLVMLVLYGLYSVFGGSDQKKKKKVATPPPPPQVVTPRKKRRHEELTQTTSETATTTVTAPSTSRKLTKRPDQLKREIEEKMRNMQEQQRRNQQRESKSYEKQPSKPIYEEEFVTNFIPEKVAPSKYFNYDKQVVVRSNLDDSPKTHKEDVHFKTRKRNKGVTIGKNFKFNAKDAIIYKEIMERKYF